MDFMDRNLLDYFDCSNMDEGIIKLKSAIKLANQLSLYDSIYMKFLESASVYDENTIIPDLDLILKLFILTFYYRNIIYPCNDCHLVFVDPLILWLLDIYKIESISSDFLMMKCFQFASMVDVNCTLNPDGSPEILGDHNNNTYEGIKLSSNKTNKYFYCPLIGKAGNLGFNSINNIIYVSLIEKGFARITSSLKTHFLKSDTSPHGNNVIAPIDMLTHDYDHTLGIVTYVSNLDIKGVESLIYNKIDHNVNSFNQRMFSMIIWYIFFELSVYEKFLDPGHKLFDMIKEIIDRNVQEPFRYIDGFDLKYCVKFLRESEDLILDEKMESDFKEFYSARNGYVKKGSNIMRQYLEIFRNNLKELGVDL